MSTSMALILLSVFFINEMSASLLGRDQSISVKGKLMCNGRALPNTKVKLYDDDRGVDADDLLAEGKTDREGNFQLSGHDKEMTTIDPKINIYHDCNDELTPCQKKVTIKIPDSYVTSGKIPSKTFDAGQINLAGKFPGETRDCLN